MPSCRPRRSCAIINSAAAAVARDSPGDFPSRFVVGLSLLIFHALALPQSQPNAPGAPASDVSNILKPIIDTLDRVNQRDAPRPSASFWDTFSCVFRIPPLSFDGDSYRSLENPATRGCMSTNQLGIRHRRAYDLSTESPKGAADLVDETTSRSA